MAVNTRAMTVGLAAAGVVAVGAIAATQIENRSAPSPNPEFVQSDIDAATFRQVAQRQMPTVVSIRTVTETNVSAMDFGRLDPFREFFESPGPVRPRIMEGAGSGFIIDAAGLVLTNHHVVADARDIEVTLYSDPQLDPDTVKRFKARVLGRDPLTDSALLQVDGARDLPIAKLGDSDAIRPGDWVVAIGNPFALSHTVTVGVISATSRPFPVEGRLQRVLQTDAAINPGNSGGPLLNLRGEVVGVNTAILSGSSGGNVGVGFAVPINLVRDLMTDLRKGDVRRGRLGVEITNIPSSARSALGAPESGGVLIATVERAGPAERAGLKPGDLILTFNGETVDSPDELGRLASNAAPNSAVTLGVIRDKSRIDVKATLGELTLARATGRPAAETPNGLGLTLTTINPDVARQRGLQLSSVVVSDVERGSPAAEAGIQTGDVVLEVNRVAVRSLDDAASRLRDTPAGGTAFLLVSRSGQPTFLVITKPR